MTWQYGVTTVPQRFDGVLPRALASLREAGFDAPILFVDGAADGNRWRERFGLEVTSRSAPALPFGNWLLSLAELWVKNPWADRYALFQDDLVACRNVRAYLERAPMPPGRWYLNLFTFMDNERVVAGKRGWVEASLVNPVKTQQTGRGGLGLVFTSEGVRDLLTKRSLVERPMDRTQPNAVNRWFRGQRRLDGAVVDAMNGLGYREWVHAPSLLQHQQGHASSIYHGKVYQQAKTFPGESHDALGFLEGVGADQAAGQEVGQGAASA